MDNLVKIAVINLADPYLYVLNINKKDITESDGEEFDEYKIMEYFEKHFNTYFRVNNCSWGVIKGISIE